MEVAYTKSVIDSTQECTAITVSINIVILSRYRKIFVIARSVALFRFLTRQLFSCLGFLRETIFNHIYIY